MLSLEYAAGFFDGEGSVSIAKFKTMPNGRLRYDLRVSVDNTYLPILVSFKEKFGGGVYPHKTRSEKHSASWSWCIYRKHARSFLTQLLPYLIVKKIDAEIGLAFLDLYRTGPGRGPKSALTEQEIGEREGLRLKLISKHGLASRAVS